MSRYKVCRQLSREDAAYLAGLIDGEGTIALSRKHLGVERQLVLSISSTEIELLEWAVGHRGRQDHPQTNRRRAPCAWPDLLCDEPAGVGSYCGCRTVPAFLQAPPS